MKKLLLMAFVLLGASQAAAVMPKCYVGQSVVCNNLGQSCTCVSNAKLSNSLTPCQINCMIEEIEPCLC